jgi:hypothetical protein
LGSGSYEAEQMNDPAAPWQPNVFVSMSGPPFGAVLPSRNSFARPAVGTRIRTENDAALCVWIMTELDLPLGTVSSKAILPPAANAAGAARAATSAPISQSRTRQC